MTAREDSVFLVGKFNSADAQMGGWGNSITTIPRGLVSLEAHLAIGLPLNSYADQVIGILGPAELTISVDESRGIRCNPRSLKIPFDPNSGSQKAVFQILSPENPGAYKAWVEVFDENRKLCSLPLDLMVKSDK